MREIQLPTSPIEYLTKRHAAQPPKKRVFAEFCLGQLWRSHAAQQPGKHRGTVKQVAMFCLQRANLDPDGLVDRLSATLRQPSAGPLAETP